MRLLLVLFQLCSAMIEHESKLRIQQKALIQTTDAALKAQAETLAAELPTSLEEAGRRALSAAFCSDRGGHRSAAREKDDDVESCYHRCVQIISRAADAYAQRKKTVALESLNAEVQAMNRAAGPPLSKFSSSDTESVEPTLKQLLEAEICLALEKERKHLMIDEASSISADKRDAEDILGLIQMNLHLAAKIAVLKALDS